MSSQPQLRPTLGLRFVIVFAIANIIGSGVYKKVAPMTGALHASGWVLAAWVIGGIISLFGALSYAEVAGLLADTGGDYVYYKRIYNRFFAFQFGWSTFAVIQTASISSLAYVFAQSFNSIYPLPEYHSAWEHFHIGSSIYPFESLPIKFLAIASIVLLTWINSRGLKTGAWMSTAILLLVFAGILLIVVFGFSSPQSEISRAFSFRTSGGQAVSFSAMFTAMMAAFWGYQGWASVGYIGGEAKNANRNIPRGITIGIFIIIALYLLVNTAYLSLLPVESLEQINQHEHQIAAIEAVKVFWGRNGEIFIGLLIVITTLGCNHATIITSCRIYFAMAREGLFFRRVGLLNKHAVPGASLWIQCVWACILVMSGTFELLTDLIIFAVFVFYGATALGVFVLRKTLPDAPRPYKVWGYPMVPAIVILFSGALFVNTIVTQPEKAGIGLALMLSGVPMWYWFNQKIRPGTNPANPQ